jgi:hypothetical protein
MTTNNPERGSSEFWLSHADFRTSANNHNDVTLLLHGGDQGFESPRLQSTSEHTADAKETPDSRLCTLSERCLTKGACLVELLALAPGVSSPFQPSVNRYLPSPTDPSESFALVSKYAVWRMCRMR